MCKIAIHQMTPCRARVTITCIVCITWISIFLALWQVFRMFKPSFVKVDPMASRRDAILNRQHWSQPRVPPPVPESHNSRDVPLPGVRSRPTMPPWALNVGTQGDGGIIPYSNTVPPTVSSQSPTTKSPAIPVTFSPTTSRAPTSLPSHSPTTRAPTWRPTADRPHSEFLLLATNNVMRPLRDFIGVMHFQNADKSIYVVASPHLATMYLAELTNTEHLVVIPSPRSGTTTTSAATAATATATDMTNQEPYDTRLNMYDQLQTLIIASNAFPGTCFLMIDLSCISVWLPDTLASAALGQWPPYFHVPGPVSCDLPKMFQECHGNGSPMLLMPAKLYWSQTHHEIRRFVKSTPYHINNTTIDNDDYHAKLVAMLDLHFEYQESNPGKALSLTQVTTVHKGRHPRCNLHHILRSQDIHPLPQQNSRLNICYCIPTRGNSQDWSTHPLIVSTLGTMYLTLNSSSTRFNRRLYVGWEDSDSTINAFQGARILLREIRHALRDTEMEIMLVELPPSDQDIVYIWNSLFAKAFDDGCDYLMHLTDDVDFVNSPGVGLGWEDVFVDLLRAGGNLGLISGLKHLNTQPFVHRTHIEIFGSFYPTSLHNIWCDTVIWALYNNLGMLRGPVTMEHWINLSDEESSGGVSTRRYADCAMREEWTPQKSLETWSPKVGIFNRQTVLDYIAEKLGKTTTITPTTPTTPKSES